MVCGVPIGLETITGGGAGSSIGGGGLLLRDFFVGVWEAIDKLMEHSFFGLWLFLEPVQAKPSMWVVTCVKDKSLATTVGSLYWIFTVSQLRLVCLSVDSFDETYLLMGLGVLLVVACELMQLRMNAK